MYKIIIFIMLCLCTNIAYARGKQWNGYYTCPTPSSLIIKNGTYSGNAAGFQVFSDSRINPLQLSGESKKLAYLKSTDAKIFYRTQDTCLYYNLVCFYVDNRGEKMSIQSEAKCINFGGKGNIIATADQSQKYGEVYGAAMKIIQ